MKLPLTLPTVLIIALLTGCQSKNEKPKVKTHYFISKSKFYFDEADMMLGDTTYIEGGVNNTNYYDDKGELIRIESSNGHVTTYERTATKGVATTKDSSGRVVKVSTDFIDEKHKRTDSSSVMADGENTYAMKYFYGEGNHPIETRQYSYGRPEGTSKFSLKNGQLISSEWISARKSIDTVMQINPVTLEEETVVLRIDRRPVTMYYEYDSAKLDLMEYRGRYLTKKEVQTMGGDTNFVKHFRCVLDDKGRVITDVSFTEDGTRYDSIHYSHY